MNTSNGNNPTSHSHNSLKSAEKIKIVSIDSFIFKFESIWNKHESNTFYL